VLRSCSVTGACGRTATLGSTTISANTVTGFGGGIYQDANSAALTNSTVEYNHAPSGKGGGIYLNTGTVTLTSSTVAWNKANNCSLDGSVAGCTG
jgi:hypothetical protein